MSRLTGTDVLGLFEAYQEVYVPQELTEEQVWEEVEFWVNSLVEEGYDLSDYTWEEMYESYLEEASDLDMGLGRKVLRDRADRAKTAPRSPSPATPQPQLKGLSIGPGGFNINNKPGNTGISPIFQRPGTKPAPATPASAKPAAPTAASRSAATSPAARPSAGAPARPTVTAAPKPAATAPAAKPATGMLGKTSFERRTPTSAELKAAQASRAGGEKNPEKVLQAAKAASTPAPSPARTGFGVSAAPIAARLSASTATASPSPAAAKPTPAAVNRATGSKKPGSIVSGFDMFDIVKGHLLDEGFADTEQAALAIMANMSEEWKRSIVEETRRTEYLQKKFNKENKKKSGSAHNYIPGKQNTGQALQKARESERHMRGDK